MSVLVKPSDFDDVERVSERVLQNSYAPFQHHFIEFLAAHLSDSSRLFNGDLEEMLVCVVLARANLRDEVGQSRRKSSSSAERSSLSAARLSELTGVEEEHFPARRPQEVNDGAVKADSTKGTIEKKVINVCFTRRSFSPQSRVMSCTMPCNVTIHLDEIKYKAAKMCSIVITLACA